jgi:hypothetical protein
MKSISIFPGSITAISQALDMFGEKRVRIGEWNEPILVSGLTAEEIVYAVKFFNGLGCEVNAEHAGAAVAATTTRGERTHPELCAKGITRAL